MKNIDEVQFALELLKNNTENDFERHRIAVLEQDLANPPQVEQIDGKRQKFNNDIYHNTFSDLHYRTNISVHRAIYSYYYGEIPDGYVIHHKDFNPENNSIENLQCVTTAEHRVIHNNDMPKEITFCKICGKKMQSYNKSKYCSRKCRDIAESFVKICPICGKEFKTVDKRTVHCSASCAQKARQLRRKEKRNNQVFICRHCGKTYTGNESNSSQFCSSNCSSSYSYYKCVEVRTCEICGKEFTCNRSRATKTCSPSCANHLRWRTRQKKSRNL